MSANQNKRLTRRGEPGAIEITETGDAWFVRLSGDFGFEIDDIQTAFNTLVAKRPEVVVLDLGGLTMISSLLLGALVGLRRSVVRSGGEIRMQACAPLVRDVLRRVQLDTLFGLGDDTVTPVAVAAR
jgi:anti-anti-sigma factor